MPFKHFLGMLKVKVTGHRGQIKVKMVIYMY